MISAAMNSALVNSAQVAYLGGAGPIRSVFVRRLSPNIDITTQLELVLESLLGFSSGGTLQSRASCLLHNRLQRKFT